MQIGKKISKINYFFLSVVYVVSFLLFTLIPTIPAKALTAGNFVLHPGTSPNTVNPAYANGAVVNGQFLASEDYFTNGGLSQISVLVKEFPTLGDFAIRYNPDRSTYFGKDQDRFGDDDVAGAGELFFTFTYFCGGPDNRISKSSLGTGVDQYQIEYAVALFPIRDGAGLTKQFAGQDSYRVASGPIAAVKKFKLSDGKADETVYQFWDSKDEAQQVGPQDITSNLGKFQERGLPAACMPPSTTGEATIRNYNKLTDAQKEPFEASAEAATAATSDTAAQPDCTMKASSPLSWIICPLVDMGANFSDFAFKKIIAPLLIDVPVSTDPADGAYKAWQQFRILGNVVLVGAMLAVVYAQIKGS